MLFIAKYRSIFKENFVCPYIPPLKRAGFTDIWIKILPEGLDKLCYDGIGKFILKTLVSINSYHCQGLLFQLMSCCIQEVRSKARMRILIIFMAWSFKEIYMLSVNKSRPFTSRLIPS